MSKRRHDSEVVFLRAGAGFGPGHCYGQIEPEPEYQLPRPRAEPIRLQEVNPPCPLDCADRKCREWTNVRLLPGRTRPEALANLTAGRCSGYAYHVSECEMSDERPEPSGSQ